MLGLVMTRVFHFPAWPAEAAALRKPCTQDLCFQWCETGQAAGPSNANAVVVRPLLTLVKGLTTGVPNLCHLEQRTACCLASSFAQRLARFVQRAPSANRLYSLEYWCACDSLMFSNISRKFCSYCIAIQLQVSNTKVPSQAAHNVAFRSDECPIIASCTCQNHATATFFSRPADAPSSPRA